MEDWKRLVAALLATMVAGCSAATWVKYRMNPDYPRAVDSTHVVAGLGGEVLIYLDEGGVPHIEASTELDLMRAVGFAHGRDRFFQMDLLRRYSQGRLSELLGEQDMGTRTSVELDAAMRGWGFAEACRRDLENTEPELLDLLEAYADGVNAARAEFPTIEHRLLRVEAEPWRPVDSLSVGLLTAWGITHNWKQEAARLLFAVHGGIERSERLYPSRAWPGATSIELTGEPHELPPAIVEEVRALFPPVAFEPFDTAAVPAFPDPFPGGAASDGWALGGTFTASGKPIVANDPHLTHTAPSLFYQQHLHCPEVDVIGITVPGVPFILVGHNRHVAWGLTSAVADAGDLYIEKPTDGDGAEVMGPRGIEPVTTEIRSILIRRRRKFDTRDFPLRRTSRGPLLNDLYPGLLPADGPLVSLHWDLAGVARGMEGYRQANRATNVEELIQAFHQVTVPLNAVVSGDVHGKIALSTTGRIPVRKNHLGTFPVPAWNSGYLWDGFVPQDRMPVVIGGEQDRIVHANNLMYDPTRAPIFFGIDSAPDYRVVRSFRRLDETGEHTVDRSIDIQHDVKLLRGERLTPVFLAALQPGRDWSEREKAALALLEEWDFEATPDSGATAVFFATYRAAVLMAMADELPPKARRFVLSLPYPYFFFDQWFENEEHPAWDDRQTSEVETRSEVLWAAFRQAVKELEEKLGRKVQKWTWGELHFRQFKHPFGSKKILAKKVNMPRSPAGGAWGALRKSHFDMGNPDNPYRSIGGAVLRMAVDMADVNRGRWIIETGASGWAGSPHYRDQHKLWVEGKSLPMLFDWNEVPEKSSAMLRLTGE